MVSIELHYLPSLEYFCALLPHSTVFVEKHEHFVKQSYRNRCYVNTSQGIQMLSVPVADRHGKIPVGEVKIDNRQRWQSIHWRTLESAYRNAPFFEHYEAPLQAILHQPYTFLFDLNTALLSFCLKALRWEKERVNTSRYEAEMPVGVSDLRGIITPKKTYADRNFYRPHPYYQVFGSTFAGNLSVVDLLFCMGPQANTVLQVSAAK